MEDRFRLALDLHRTMGEATLPTGSNLRTELRLGGDISLWDVVASYLVLYRFPLLFCSNGVSRRWSRRVTFALRPYRGLAARWRDVLVSPPARTLAGCSTWPTGKRNVLFLGFVSNFYRDVLRPVAQSLAEKSIGVVVINEDRDSTATVRTEEGIHFQSLWGHWDNDAARLSGEMSASLKKLRRGCFDGPSPGALDNEAVRRADRFSLSREFHWLFRRELPRLIPQVAAASHILDRHGPALIVSADDADQRCRIYSLLARKRNIPTLLVQQGLSSKEYPEWSLFSQSAVAAMGYSSRADMLAQGIPSEKIILTGHPGFDHLAVPEKVLSADLRKSLGVSNGEKMLLFASQPYYVGVFNTPGIRKEMIVALVRACHSLENVRLVVKPHPGDNLHELKTLIGKAPFAQMVDRTMDITPLIKACDILVTFFSTAALQALYAGKPVINLAFPDSGGLNLYSESGATWTAQSEKELVSHLQALAGRARKQEMTAREEHRRRFLSDMLYQPDGKATQRVLQMIMNMLGEPSNT